MTPATGHITGVVLGATYPLELLHDAVFLRDQALADAAANPADERGIPGSRQRAFSRAAMFTAFNFLEGLLIELSQSHVTTGPLKGTATAQTILDELRNGQAAISRTVKEWPLALMGKDVSGTHHFRHFKEIRGFRNQLIHVKLEPLGTDELTQDQLLLYANAAEAEWVVGQISVMAAELYRVFRRAVPPEVSGEVVKAPKKPPARR